MSTDIKVAVQDLSYTFADGTQALKNINLDIRPKELFVLFGPSRSGKSTLLRLMNRLSDLTAGSTRTGDILFDGVSIFGRNVNITSLRRRISMVFALPTPLPGTIYDNITYGLRMAGQTDKRFLDERVETSLKQAAIWDEVKDRLDKSAFALSGGQKQRVCLARSLALEPDVILLDNPTSGLDPISTAAVEESLYQLKEQYTIILVPHSIAQATRVADRAAFILGGDIIDSGTQEEVFINPKNKQTEDYIMGRFG